MRNKALRIKAAIAALFVLLASLMTVLTLIGVREFIPPYITIYALTSYFVFTFIKILLATKKGANATDLSRNIDNNDKWLQVSMFGFYFMGSLLDFGYYAFIVIHLLLGLVYFLKTIRDNKKLDIYRDY